MTTTAARTAILDQIAADIRCCAEAPARAAHYEETVWETWELLFNEGQYTRARQWWLDEIQPTFQQR
jgi:hypothetical protein